MRRDEFRREAVPTSWSKAVRTPISLYDRKSANILQLVKNIFMSSCIYQSAYRKIPTTVLQTVKIIY